MIDKEKLGANIKHLRETYTYANIHSFCGYHGFNYRNYCRYENGERLPGIEILSKLSKIYSIPINKILEFPYRVIEETNEGTEGAAHE